MKVLLILKNDKGPRPGIVVAVCPKTFSDRVVPLLEKNKGQEAFNLLKRESIPESYIPAGDWFKKYVPTLFEGGTN
ncbi:MAG: hypothetical protein HQL13_00730 [Candidatus Omnitrophica bacterium]|nr:hypothetical protein [Candidatus Omnitrophota bacterium]